MPSCFEKVHVLFSLSVMGTLNLECAVRPLGNVDAAMLDVAVAIPINPFERTLARIALYRNVFLFLLDHQRRTLGSCY